MDRRPRDDRGDDRGGRDRSRSRERRPDDRWTAEPGARRSPPSQRDGFGARDRDTGDRRGGYDQARRPIMPDPPRYTDGRPAGPPPGRYEPRSAGVDDRPRDIRHAGGLRGDDLRHTALSDSGASAAAPPRNAVAAARELLATATSSLSSALPPLPPGPSMKPGGASASSSSSAADDRFVDDEDEEESAPLPPPPPPPDAPPPGDAPPPSELAVPVGMDEEVFMAQMMGFGSFGSTKGKHVEDNDTTAARGAAAKPLLKREYRQYMHRKGGFNRDLAAQPAIKRR